VSAPPVESGGAPPETERQPAPGSRRPFWKDPVVLIGTSIPTIILIAFFGYLHFQWSKEHLRQEIIRVKGQGDKYLANKDIGRAFERYDSLLRWVGNSDPGDGQSQSALESVRRSRDRLLPEVAADNFDTRDPEVTFRWLIQEALPIKESSKASDDEHFNNPLRKDSYDAHKVDEKKWEQFLKRLPGKRITWPARIERITGEEVDFACFPEGVREKDITVKVQFDPYPAEYEDENWRMEILHHGTYRPHCNGKLIIGRDISLDAARTLDRKTWIHIEGTLERVESDVAKPYTSYPDIRLYVKTTGVLVPVAK
jgi:hypothetical protein